MVSGERLEASGLNLGEFRTEPLVFSLLLRGPRYIGQVVNFKRILLQVVHLPLAPHDAVRVVVLGQLVALLANAGDVVWRRGIRATLLARLVIVVCKGDVVLHRRS